MWHLRVVALVVLFRLAFCSVPTVGCLPCVVPDLDLFLFDWPTFAGSSVPALCSRFGCAQVAGRAFQLSDDMTSALAQSM
jgi:hypothetical protein